MDKVILQHLISVPEKVLFTNMALTSEVYESYRYCFIKENNLKRSCLMKYKPSFCPNPFCPMHEQRSPNKLTSLKQKKWYVLKGYRYILNGQAVQRYQCKICRKGFSDRTFSINYWEKKHIDYNRLLFMLISCMGLRAVSRAFKCSPRTIENKLSRLTRQAVAVNSILREYVDLREDLSADGFESYTVSQYFPNNFNLLVGKDSQFVYFFNFSQLRRKGHMTEAQRCKAETLKKLVPIASGEVKNRFAELTDEVVRLQYKSRYKQNLLIDTDEKKEYAAELLQARYAMREKSEGFRLIHRRTSSRRPRTRFNPLFPVNYLDREIRKDLAEHVRESTRFGRNVNSALGRMELYLFYHNYLKPFRINRKKRIFGTHAEAAGLNIKMIEKLLTQWMKRRYFKSHLKLDLHAEKVWRRAYSTPGNLFMDILPAYVFS